MFLRGRYYNTSENGHWIWKGKLHLLALLQDLWANLRMVGRSIGRRNEIIRFDWYLKNTEFLMFDLQVRIWTVGGIHRGDQDSENVDWSIVRQILMRDVLVLFYLTPNYAILALYLPLQPFLLLRLSLILLIHSILLNFWTFILWILI